uniref:Ig-like domain-containing protein n=1 Tax=Sinocyclocheilus rhinocerous TaxID=307959 RepID=A0A673IPA2_9TELE
FYAIKPVFNSLLSSSAGVFSFSELSFTVEPKDVAASHGERVILDCQAQGESPVGVRWRKNGLQLHESGRLRVLSNGSLCISSSAQSDEGFYQCLAQNRYGAVLSQRSRLTISSRILTKTCTTSPKPKEK